MHPKLNPYIKTVLISLLTIVVSLAIGGIVIVHFFHDRVVGFAVESINKQVSSRVEIQSAHFSIFRKFPNAAVEFRNVVMSSARDFDPLDFEPARSRQLLSAESVFAEMNLFRLLTGNYRITRIEVHNGSINLLTDQNRRHNFIFWKTSEKSNDHDAPIELQNVTLHNVDIYYAHRRSNTAIALYAEKAHLGGRFSSRQYSISADWQGLVRFFSVDDDVLIHDKTLELSGKLDVEDDRFTIRRSELTLAKVKMNLSGGFSTEEDVDLDLLIEGKQMDYASITSALPERYGQMLHDYPGKGNVNFTASIKGKAGSGFIPMIDAQFGMKQGQITHRQSKVRLTDLSFSGSFVTGDQKQRSTGMLQINDADCRFGGGKIRGALIVKNFAKPQVTVKITGNTDLEQLYRFFPSPQIASAGGQMNGDLTLNVRLKRLQLSETDDIDHLELQGVVNLDNASLHLRDPDYRFSSINGSLQLGNRVNTDHLSLILNGNDFRMDGYMERLTSCLLKRSKTVFLKANIKSQQICVDSLLTPTSPISPISPASPVSPISPVSPTSSPLLPSFIDFETHIEAAKFRYRKFEADHLKADLVYQPRILEVRSVAFSAMSGKLTGSGDIANDQANHIHVLGETTLDGMDIHQLFNSFDGFGQDVLRAEHVKGKLSGDLAFSVGWDDRMQLLQDRVMVEGKMDLNGGELIHFEPMNNLSRFVALDELQNIRFQKLRTHISVKDRKLIFPQTDVQTSAFDIMLSGEHLFDNSYTYRVKILLSELLAAKARRAKRENRENEYAEDGGKRTALYLKIEGQGSNFNIGYDKQSAKASVAADIRNEKQTLKNILKEEFGWFKKDTLLKPATPENTGTLRFTFDDDEPQKNNNDKKKKETKDEEKIKVEWE